MLPGLAPLGPMGGSTGPATIAYKGTASLVQAGSTFTATDVPIGTPSDTRVVVLSGCVGWTDTLPTAIAINGVPATIAAKQAGGAADAWVAFAVVPGGSTATITADTSCFGLAVYEVQNAKTDALWYAAYGSGSTSPSASVTAPAGAVVVGSFFCARTNRSRSTGWSGLTMDVQVGGYPVWSAASKAFAEAQSGLAISAFADGDLNYAAFSVLALR